MTCLFNVVFFLCLCSTVIYLVFSLAPMVTALSDGLIIVPAAWDVAQEEAQWQRPDGPRLLASQVCLLF